MLSCFSHVWLFVILWTIVHQSPLCMGLSRQEYWSGLTCSPPGDLPDPGIGPAFFRCSALVGRFFTTNATWEAQKRVSRNLTQSAGRAAFFSGRQRKNVLPCISQLLENASFHWLMGSSLEAQMIKNLPAVLETPVRSLGQKNPLEKGMATHSSILVWRIPWTEETGGL